MSRSIAMLGWALPSMGVREGSGYNLNAGELAAGLVERGHRVSFLRSGVAFSFKSAIRIRRIETWRGVVCDEVVNSPVVAPAYFNFAQPRAEMAGPVLVREVMTWLDGVKADVVHVHSLEGFTHDVMAAIAASGRRLVVTLHNHWFVCPQVDLLYRQAEPCTSYDGGRRCETCMRPPDVQWTRNAAAGRRLSERLLRAFSRPLPDPLGVKALVRRLTRTPNVPPAQALERPPVVAEADAKLLAANDKLVVLNDYGERRSSALAAINCAHRVLVPSGWMRDVAVSFGLDAEKVVHVPLGQPHFDGLAAHPRRRPLWRPGCGRPLSVVFLGSGDLHKGLQLLAAMVSDSALWRRVQFTVRAAWYPAEVERQLRSAACVELGKGYTVVELPAILDEADVVLYPQICFDNSPLVVMEALHAGVPVVASDLGGPRSLVSHEANGLLFRAGDAGSMAATLERIVEGAWALPDAASVRVSAGLPTHGAYLDRVEQIYGESPVG